MQPQPPGPVCVRHVDRVTGLACTRCNRPACADCLRPAAVGQHCVDCLRQDRRSTPQVRTVAGAPAGTAPRPLVTYALIAINLVIFGITAAQANSVLDNQRSRLFLQWVLYPPAVADGEWWRVLGSGFLHYGPLHLLVNMFALYVVGRDCELVLGRVRYLLVYLVALLGGSAGVMLLSQDSLTAGASGAVYGLFGAVTVVLIRLRQSPNQMLIVIGINVIISLSLPGISLWGHLGGLAAGTLATLGVLFLPQWAGAKSPAAARTMGWVSLAAVGLGALAVIGAAGLSLAA